jgi:hypothetical protein
VIIDCPNCAKTYCLPPGIIASPSFKAELPPSHKYGWLFSCAGCNHQWWQVSKNDFSLNNDLRVSAPSPPSFSSTFKAEERSPLVIKKDQSVILSLVSIFIITLSLGCVGYLYRQPLKTVWYQATGRPLPTTQPLVLQNVQYNLSASPNPADDSQILTIEGAILNPNKLTIDAPVLRISVWADCQGHANETRSPFSDCLYLEWLYRPTALQINGSGVLPFQTSYPISANITRVEVAIP